VSKVIALIAKILRFLIFLTVLVSSLLAAVAAPTLMVAITLRGPSHIAFVLFPTCTFLLFLAWHIVLQSWVELFGPSTLTDDERP
jgi:hypothetical protein